MKDIEEITVSKDSDRVIISTISDALIINKEQAEKLYHKLYEVLSEKNINKAKKELIDTRNALTFEMQDIIRIVDNDYPLEDDILKFGILVERAQDTLSLLVSRYNHYWDIKGTDWEKDIK